jgi:hypothetical protein
MGCGRIMGDSGRFKPCLHVQVFNLLLDVIETLIKSRQGPQSMYMFKIWDPVKY